MDIKTKIYNILGKRKNLEKNICIANKYLKTAWCQLDMLTDNRGKLLSLQFT